MSFFTELKRRNVFRVGAAYVVVAWLVIQVGDVAADNLGFPDWFMPMVFVLLGLGLPIALVLSWAFELTPAGVKRTEDVEPADSVTPQTGRRLDRFIVIALLAIIAVLAVERIWFAGGPGEAGVTEAPTAAAEPPAAEPPTAESPAEPPPLPAAAKESVSGIAVLPFLNMSPDPENEYFADGISEELLNILAGIDGLKVASRTSAFSFKGKNVPVAEIAELLDVQHVLEGSVRKQGTRVRITAQLIDAENDAHLWSETYERDLVDIFRVQEEIALAITAALGDILGTPQVSVEAPTRDLEAYQSFLRGRSRFYQRVDLDQAIADLQAAVDRDPDFAEAWAFLAAATGVVAGGGYSTQLVPEELVERSDRALDMALMLQPEIPIALAGKGRVLVEDGHYAEGLALLERAASKVNPDTSPRLWLGISQAEIGLVREALEWFESATTLDPLVAINQGYVGYAYAVVGRDEEAVRSATRGLELTPTAPYWMQLLAIDAFHRGDLARFEELWARWGVPATEAFRDSAGAAALNPALRAPLWASLPDETAGQNSWRVVVALLLQDTDKLFEAARVTHRSGANYMRFAAWFPSFDWLREDPRFFEFMRESGALDYWETEGYPSGCRPVDDPAGRRLDCSEYAP